MQQVILNGSVSAKSHVDAKLKGGRELVMFICLDHVSVGMVT